jgi:hypothetical protein
MILYRHADPRFPFLWESSEQPPARWHDSDEGPVHYFADTPDGAWAEFLRHEGITSEDELENIRRVLWAVEVSDALQAERPDLPNKVMRGGIDSYGPCRQEARRLRDLGVLALKAPSAALVIGGARGWKVDGGLQPAGARDGVVIVLFGTRPDLTGWVAATAGRPVADLLAHVRHLKGKDMG